MKELLRTGYQAPKDVAESDQYTEIDDPSEQPPFEQAPSAKQMPPESEQYGEVDQEFEQPLVLGEPKFQASAQA